MDGSRSIHTPGRGVGRWRQGVAQTTGTSKRPQTNQPHPLVLTRLRGGRGPPCAV